MMSQHPRLIYMLERDVDGIALLLLPVLLSKEMRCCLQGDEMLQTSKPIYFYAICDQEG